MSLYSSLCQAQSAQKRLLAVLLDPAKTPLSSLPVYLPYLQTDGVDMVLVGGSGDVLSLDAYVSFLRASLPTAVPVVLFPGNLSQFTAEADAVLFLSLLSGRNADMLIGQQVKVARRVATSGVEPVGMGYILVDGQRLSTVEKVSGTLALSQNDVETIVDTALAAELLGMKTVYLEAGSGAKVAVSEALVRSVRQAVRIPLFVGGGIRSVEAMQKAFSAGATVVVIGNHFEQHPELIPHFAKAKYNSL